MTFNDDCTPVQLLPDIETYLKSLMTRIGLSPMRFLGLWVDMGGVFAGELHDVANHDRFFKGIDQTFAPSDSASQ